VADTRREQSVDVLGHDEIMTGAQVAVIGAGNVGCALAAHLTLRGIDVHLCNRSGGRLEEIRRAGGITVTGVVDGFAPIAMLTTDVREAVDGVDVVAVAVPAPALPQYAALLATSTTDEQVIWLDPGHSGGALYLGAELRRRGRRPPLICQLSTASHGSRMTAPAAVGVFARPSASLAAFPSRDREECHRRVDALLPGQFSTASSVLELDLQNVNAVMHPAQMVCNASWIEATGGDFFIYREGSGRATTRVIEAVDAERMELAKRLGVPTLSLVAALARAGYTTPEAASSGSVYEALQAGEPISRVKAPPALDHRYLHEDVGWGLVLWIHLASAVGLAMPAMEALVAMASVLNGVDYTSHGLTLERMGLIGMDAADIGLYVQNGPQ
jgi:opine dehydrogenase